MNIHSLEKYLKNVFFYIFLGLIMIVVGVTTTLLVMRFAGNSLPLQETKINTAESTITIDLPFDINTDDTFEIDSEISSFVRYSNAFRVEGEGLVINIYAIAYRNELFLPTWTPSLDDLAQTGINLLSKNANIINLVHEKENRKISGQTALEVISRYRKSNITVTRRAFHFADRNTTWSIEATYQFGDDTIANTVDKIFDSIAIKTPPQ